MTDRWRLSIVGTSSRVERLVKDAYVVVGYLDPAYAEEIVNVLNGVPIGHLQKQVAIMADQVEDILARVTRLGRDKA